ncbi:unnamed protein product [Brassica oleracea var. botrytis]
MAILESQPPSFGPQRWQSFNGFHRCPFGVSVGSGFTSQCRRESLDSRWQCAWTVAVQI